MPIFKMKAQNPIETFLNTRQRMPIMGQTNMLLRVRKEGEMLALSSVLLQMGCYHQVWPAYTMGLHNFVANQEHPSQACSAAWLLIPDVVNLITKTSNHNIRLPSKFVCLCLFIKTLSQTSLEILVRYMVLSREPQNRKSTENQRVLVNSFTNETSIPYFVPRAYES